MIPYGRQDINQSDIDAVVEVLRSDYLTQGPAVPAFERTVENYCGVKHAVAVNSATSALHIACLALGVGQGDIVWTTPITFVASANCALYCGATVDFVDIDALTYNMSVERLAEKLARAEQTKTLPKVVIPVHLCGQPCDMEGIHQLSKQYGFRIIEDASHAIGGRYKNEPIGSCRFSDITVFSFHPVKIITTGEGGMAVSNDAVLANHMVRLRSHGITRDPAEMTHLPDGPWYYQQIELGFNYRMTELQGALGCSQMQRLNDFVAIRHGLALHYDNLLKNTSVTVPWQHPDSYSGLHLYVIRVPQTQKKVSRNEIFERLRTNGVGANLHYIPIYRQPYYERMGFDPSDFPEAESYYAEAITLPMYPGLSNEQQLEVVQRLCSPIGHQTIF
jgi:UDP-4-amino-4,6-dideoxy-N-acetyl-beta-L-altrosamine transaminase